MSIASDIIRGHTDTIRLARLAAGDSYGYEINKAIERKTEGKYELKEATLYTAFKRLEENLGALAVALWAADVAEISAAVPAGAAAGTRYPAGGMKGVQL